MWSLNLSTVILLIAIFHSYCSTAHNIANKTTFVNATTKKFKILSVFGHPGKSHVNMFLPLMEELARRGHHVTVLSYYPRSDSTKAKEPLPTYRDVTLEDSKVGLLVNVVNLEQIKQTNYHILFDLIMLRSIATLGCESILLHNPTIKEFIRSNEQFDLLITENFNTDCFLGFAHRFKMPYLSMSSHQIMPWANENMGNVDNPSYIPIIFNGYEYPIDFLKRMINTVQLVIAKAAFEYWFRPIDQAIVDEAFGPGVPKLKTLAQQSQALLVNTHFSIHSNRPQLSNIIEVGGLHLPSKINLLPKEIAEFLDNAHEGVLYFNLGSMINLSTMPAKKMDAILNVISSIPRKVIWKWETDLVPRKMSNVMARKWLPQFDILNHPNVKCYFGHGGLLGLSEAVYAGVPMVLMPIYGDQFHNSYAAKDRGVAEVLEYNNLDEQSLRQALDQVFNNTSYRENARILSRAYRDRPVPPMETAVWWTEYIARGNGKPYLRSKGADLPWYQYHLVDVALVLIIIFAVFIYILFRLIKLLLSLLCAVKGKLGSRTMKRKKD